MNIGIKKFFNGIEPKSVLNYNEFVELSANTITNTNEKDLDELGKKYLEYKKINLQRTNRIQKNYKPKQDLIDLVKRIDKPQYWLAITEDWCGDSAQNLPYIVKYVEQNENIDFKVILRDDNLEAIDLYFEDGNPRSIPKIVAFDQNGNELFVWGPRPKVAQNLVSKLKAEGYSREEFNKELHLWYGRNRGKELEKELITLFSQMKNI